MRRRRVPSTRTVQRALSIDDYVAQPIGRFYAGPTFLHFSREDLCGTAFFGRPDADAIRDLVRAIAVELPGSTPVHRAFADASLLTGVDPEAFRALAEYVGPRAEAFAENVSRQAIAHPPGVLGALVAGFYDVTPSASPERTRLFASPHAALAWLGVERPEALLAQLAAARESAQRPPEILAVRDAVVTRPRSVVLAAVAASLGVSPRALQSRLQDLGTSFRREVAAARVSVAKELLASSDTKLEAIALAVGCASLSHFSALFRSEVGQSPGQWRAAHRR